MLDESIQYLGPTVLTFRILDEPIQYLGHVGHNLAVYLSTYHNVLTFQILDEPIQDFGHVGHSRSIMINKDKFTVLTFWILEKSIQYLGHVVHSLAVNGQHRSTVYLLSGYSMNPSSISSRLAIFLQFNDKQS
jgi:hypothetical protein